MALHFFDIFKNRNVSEASSKDIAKYKNIVKSIVLSLIGLRSTSGRENFVSADIDFSEIDNAYNTDSYVRQAIDKYSELIFKAGWSFKGNNEKAIEDLENRLKIIGFSTGIPFERLIVEISEDLIKYSNAFIIKARQKQKINLIKADSVIKGKQPVAGYFRVHPKTMQASIDENGNISKWKQKVNNKEIEFDVEDVIHLYYKREAGQVFAIPYIYPVLDDIRLLRSIEDDTATLIQRYAIPIYHFIVGESKPGFEATQEEIDAVRDAVNSLRRDGALVTNERVKASIIGAEGNAIDVANYLSYFEKRVFTGLGVSETQMGRGATANKNTADALDQQMVDRVKAYQRIIENEITFNLINELLLEMGYDPITNKEDEVKFVFNEINIDTQIKIENHKTFLFEHNVITFEELRRQLGLDYDNIDESRLYANMYGKMASKKETENMDKPANQHGQQNAPNIKPKREFVENLSESVQNSIKDTYYSFMNDVKNADKINAAIIISAATSLISNKILDRCINESRAVINFMSDKYNIKSSHNDVVSKLSNSIKKDIHSILSDIYNKYTETKSVDTFITNEFRINNAFDYWAEKAKNVTKLMIYKDNNIQDVETYGASDEDEFCKERNKTINTSTFIIEEVPPFHPNCNCKISVKGRERG